MASSLILSPRDLEFLLHEWLQVETLTKRPRYAEHSRETFDAVLDLAEELATELFAPHNRLSDTDEPRVVDGLVQLPAPDAALRLEARPAASRCRCRLRRPRPSSGRQNPP